MDSKQFREALGSFATGVCVVTTVPQSSQDSTSESGQPQNAAPIGMTINSFSSVSLDPPLILWSIQTNSDCYEVFDKAEYFGVSVLNAQHENLSNTYAAKDSHTLQDEHYTLADSGCPLLVDSLADFECKVWAKYPGGDHTIIVGEVLNIQSQPMGSPLVFFKGQYHRID